MKEKLIIRNFGPIKDAELEFGEFNILIGDQGTGKSTIAKLLIAINNTCFRDIHDRSRKEDLLQSPDTNLFIEHLKLVGIENYLLKESQIRFSSDDFSFDFLDQKVSLIKNSDIDFSKIIYYDFTYIPSERNLAITLADSLYALLQTGTSLPKLFLRFGDKFTKARKAKTNFNYSEILGINYFHRESEDIVQLPSGKEISINDSSSGIQGAISLLTVFDYVIETSSFGNLLVIEEPELNCFPNTQYKLIRHFIESNFNNQNQIKELDRNEERLLITTHSPYILTSLNNLIYAYQIGQIHKERVNNVIEEKYWLNPNKVHAYQLLPNGTCENIIAEDGLIMAEKIDVISRTINEEYDKILDIQYAK